MENWNTLEYNRSLEQDFELAPYLTILKQRQHTKAYINKIQAE